MYSAPFRGLRTAPGIRQLRGLRPLRFAVLQSHASPLKPCVPVAGGGGSRRVQGRVGCRYWRGRAAGLGLHFFHRGVQVVYSCGGFGLAGFV